MQLLIKNLAIYTMTGHARHGQQPPAIVTRPEAVSQHTANKVA